MADISVAQNVMLRGTSKIVYPEIDSPLRTDENFRSRKTPCGDTDYHHTSEKSILAKLSIDMVKKIPLGKMH